jgi:hypothetical protein
MRLLFTGDDTWTAVATTPHKKSDLAHASKCERKVGGHGGGVHVADLKCDDELEGEQLNVFLQLVCSCQTVHRTRIAENTSLLHYFFKLDSVIGISDSYRITMMGSAANLVVLSTGSGPTGRRAGLQNELHAYSDQQSPLVPPLTV